MGVTYIDPAQGVLGQAIGNLGKAVSARFNRRNARESQLLANPETMKNLAPAYRAAIRANQGEAFLNSLGVDLDFGRAFDSYVPDMKEIYEARLMDLEYPRILADADIGDVEVRLETAKRTLESGVIAERIRDEVIGLQNNALYQETRSRLGTPMQEAQLEYNINTLAAQDNALALDAVKRFREYLESDQVSEHYLDMWATAVASPQFLSHVTQHESWSFQDWLARTKASGSPEDQVLTYTRWRTAYQDALEKSREADSDEDRRIAVADIHNLNLLMDRMVRDGNIGFVPELTGVEISKRWFGFREYIKYTQLDPNPELMDDLTRTMELVANGTLTRQELLDNPNFQSIPQEQQDVVLGALDEFNRDGFESLLNNTEPGGFNEPPREGSGSGSGSLPSGEAEAASRFSQGVNRRLGSFGRTGLSSAGEGFLSEYNANDAINQATWLIDLVGTQLGHVGSEAVDEAALLAKRAGWLASHVTGGAIATEVITGQRAPFPADRERERLPDITAPPSPGYTETGPGPGAEGRGIDLTSTALLGDTLGDTEITPFELSVAKATIAGKPLEAARAALLSAGYSRVEIEKILGGEN